jgi:hypothetical protein
LGDLYQRFGFLRPSLIRAESEMAVPSAYHREFGSLDAAFQKVYSEECDRARQSVQDQIASVFPEVLPYSDFIVLDRRLTISIQPAVAAPQAWTLRGVPSPAQRLGVTDRVFRCACWGVVVAALSSFNLDVDICAQQFFGS